MERPVMTMITMMNYTPLTRSSNYQANVEQTSSEHRAIRAHVVHVYFECICWTFARCLLDRVNEVLAIRTTKTKSHIRAYRKLLQSLESVGAEIFPRHTVRRVKDANLCLSKVGEVFLL